VRARLGDSICFNSAVIADCGIVRGLATGSLALLPSQTLAQHATERVVNLPPASTEGTAERQRADLRFWAGSDDVFHGAIELGTVSGTTSNDCARQTISDLIYELRGARHGVNISYFAIVSNTIVAGRLSWTRLQRLAGFFHSAI
jgi:hypothetical protein